MKAVTAGQSRPPEPASVALAIPSTAGRRVSGTWGTHVSRAKATALYPAESTHTHLTSGTSTKMVSSVSTAPARSSTAPLHWVCATRAQGLLPPRMMPIPWHPDSPRCTTTVSKRPRFSYRLATVCLHSPPRVSARPARYDWSIPLLTATTEA